MRKRTKEVNEVYEKLVRCYESIRKVTDFEPQVALVLGSGLGDYAKQIKVECTIDYKDIEGFPVSTVAGHAGRFIFGYLDTVPVVCMQGRIHYYEGYPMRDVVLPTRIMKMLGAKILFLTNAAGGIKTGMRPGDLMLITGQIASFVPSPLIGANLDELGVRFPDMSGIYDKELQMIVKKAALEQNLALQEGVYLQMTGPQYETPEEIAMCRILGASAVGMSTACEAIAANHMGMRIVGISCITNLAAGITPFSLTHEEVQRTADEAAAKFTKLVTDSILEMGKLLK